MNTLEQAGELQPFPQFPKVRLPLPQAYLSLYESEYLENRASGSLANRTARMLESWMHVKVTSSNRQAARGNPRNRCWDSQPYSLGKKQFRI